MSEFSFNLNGNLRNGVHWKLGPVFCGDHPSDFGKSPHGVQISNRAYSRKSRTIIFLKETIREEMRAIPLFVCRDVMDNFVRRIKKCTELNGDYHEHTL